MAPAYRFRGSIVERDGSARSCECVVAVADLEEATKLARKALGDPFILTHWSISEGDFAAMNLRPGEVR